VDAVRDEVDWTCRPDNSEHEWTTLYRKPFSDKTGFARNDREGLKRGQVAIDAIKQHKAVYLDAVGGAGLFWFQKRFAKRDCRF